MTSLSLLPPVVMVVGALLAVWRPPGPSLRSAILHFAAGVVFSVAAVEILPLIVHEHSPVVVALGFALGVALMLALRQLTRYLERRAHLRRSPAPGTVAAEATSANGNQLPWGLLIAIGVDIFLDGLLLGIGFAAGAKEGTLLAVALAFELFSLGLATAVELQQEAFTKARSVGIVALLAGSLVVGAAIGLTLLSHAAGGLLVFVLSFGLAALLFLVTEELLAEAHSEDESAWLTAAFFVGFLLFLLLGMVA
ncbi:ZIP family metal transporter [Hymenobacter agri]